MLQKFPQNPHTTTEGIPERTRLQITFQISILYFTPMGTWFTVTRPSYETAAKVQGSTALHATPAFHSIACGRHSCVVTITDTRPSLPSHAEVCTIDAVLMAVIARGTAVLGSAPPLAAGLPREARQMQQVDDSVGRGAEQKLVMKRVELRLPDPVGVAARLHHRLAERPGSGLV